MKRPAIQIVRPDLEERKVKSCRCVAFHRLSHCPVGIAGFTPRLKALMALPTLARFRLDYGCRRVSQGEMTVR
jgi:hypothetical protein